MPKKPQLETAEFVAASQNDPVPYIVYTLTNDDVVFVYSMTGAARFLMSLRKKRWITKTAHRTFVIQALATLDHGLPLELTMHDEVSAYLNDICDNPPADPYTSFTPYAYERVPPHGVTLTRDVFWGIPCIRLAYMNAAGSGRLFKFGPPIFSETMLHFVFSEGTYNPARIEWFFHPTVVIHLSLIVDALMPDIPTVDPLRDEISLTVLRKLDGNRTALRRYTQFLEALAKDK